MSKDRIRSVLVGSDLSESSDELIRQAAGICRNADAALHVVSAYQLPEATTDGKSLPEELRKELLSPLPAQLRRVLEASAQPTSQMVRFGRAASEILERAREVDADVIVLGPHRGRDVRASFLGTTADEVLRLSSAPCLVLRGELHLPLRRVGVGTDLSPLSRAATQTAATWAAQLGGAEGDATTALHLAYVESDGEARGATAPGGALEELAEGLAAHSEDRVQLHAETVRGGDVAQTIARWAERRSLDLLVLGTRGRGGGQRGELGSVSSVLARSAPCPVLLVPDAARAPVRPS